MRKRRCPSGERIDRTTKVLEYIASNPGCRRSNIGGYMNSFYIIRPLTVSEYLKEFLMFEITKEGEKLMRYRQAERR